MTKPRSGHAPGHVRDTFVEAVDAFCAWDGPAFGLRSRSQEQNLRSRRPRDARVDQEPSGG
jgi:hypothetical protein